MNGDVERDSGRTSEDVDEVGRSHRCCNCGLQGGLAKM